MTRLMRFLATLPLAVLSLAAPASEQRPLNEYFRETWTTRQGLPHNLVQGVAQTPDGYLWFATWEGVARYNGCPIAGDATGDGVVNADDLVAVILAWGPCPAPPNGCPADVNGDGDVNVDDLVMVILNWN